MRTRALLALVLALVATSLLATNASAASHSHGKYREVKKILRDCAKDGKLDHKYSLKALKLALKKMPDDIRYYTGCEKAIKKAIRKALLKQVKQIYRDCARDDHLNGHYSLPALKLALRLLPDDLRNYTGCKKAIKKAIRNELRKLRHEVRKIYRDCARDDDLDGRYSLAALKLALKRLPDDLRDYTGCEKAIKHAIEHGKYKKHKHHKHHGHYSGRVAAVRTT